MIPDDLKTVDEIAKGFHNLIRPLESTPKGVEESYYEQMMRYFQPAPPFDATKLLGKMKKRGDSNSAKNA